MIYKSLFFNFQGGGGGGEEEQISFHGVAYINAVPLLYPGVKRIRGAFRVYPYLDNEVFEKVRTCTKWPAFHLMLLPGVSASEVSLPCLNRRKEERLEPIPGYILMELGIPR